ncbi:MAG TPA: anti-sigma factor [Sphingomicrobium sp.]|jgi:hypothetical protein
MTEDEKFFAWLDGELDLAEAAAMESKVAANPELKKLAEQHRSLGSQLSGAFDPIASEPVPERLQAALRPSADVVDFAAAKRALSMPSLPQWAAMAATLVLGVFLGTMVPQRSAPVAVQGGKLYAAAALNRALDTELASAPQGDVRIGLTFRDRAGEICRSFTGSAGSGLACRKSGRWQLKGLFAAPEGQASDYRMAAGMDPNLAALVDSAMAGEPFDAAAEEAAKRRRWQ